MVAAFYCASLLFMLVQLQLVHVGLFISCSPKLVCDRLRRLNILGHASLRCAPELSSLPPRAPLPMVATVSGTGQHLDQFKKPHIKLCRHTSYTAAFPRHIFTGFFSYRNTCPLMQPIKLLHSPSYWCFNS